MNSLDGQREQMLRKNFPDAARFWDHIQQNKSRLKQEVFPPAILNCSIAPPHAIDAIETLIGRHCTSFVTQNMDDYYTLTEMAFGNKDKGIKGLPGIADITIRDYSRTRAPTLHQQNTQGPIPREQVCSYQVFTETQSNKTSLRRWALQAMLLIISKAPTWY